MYTTFVEMAVKQVKKTCEKSFEFGREDGFFIDKNPMEECVICMEYIKDSDKAVLKCGHQFHASCMFSNVVRENNTCPLCRAEVSEKPEIIDAVLENISLNQGILDSKLQQTKNKKYF